METIGIAIAGFSIIIAGLLFVTYVGFASLPNRTLLDFVLRPVGWVHYRFAGA